VIAGSRRLVGEATVTEEQAATSQSDVLAQIKAAHEALKETFGAAPSPTPDGRIPAGTAETVHTAVTAEKLAS